MMRSPATTDIRRFGHYIPKPNGTVDFSVLEQVASADVLAEFHEVTSTIFKLQPIIFAFNVVERNYWELNNSIHELRSQLDNSLTTNTESTSLTIDGNVLLIQKISNFLSSTTAFLEQTKTQLRKEYGKKSPELNTWHEKRHKIHADNFSYFFLYELRNFNQHCSLPFSSLNIAGERASKNAPIFFNLKAMIFRDGLFDIGYNWSEKAKERIMRQAAPEFELLPLISEYFHFLHKLCFDAVQLQSIQLTKCASYFDAVHRILKIPVGAIPVIYIGESASKEIPPSRLEVIPMMQFEYLLREYEKLLNACETE